MMEFNRPDSLKALEEELGIPIESMDKVTTEGYLKNEIDGKKRTEIRRQCAAKGDV